MGSQKQTVDVILELLEAAGAVSGRKMFGEYGLYCDGKLFALVCDDQLFLKPTSAGRASAGSLDEAVPYPGAKPYLLVPGDSWDDADWLTDMVRITALAGPLAAAALHAAYTGAVALLLAAALWGGSRPQPSSMGRSVFRYLALWRRSP